MHDSESRKNAGTTPPDHLLDELTSIKDLLGGEHPVSTGAIPHHHIPVLDDIVGARPELLDIERIFEEDGSDDTSRDASDAGRAIPGETSHAAAADVSALQFPRFTLDVAISDAGAAGDPAAAGSAVLDNLTRTLRANYRRELLIQELVGEFLPQIEAALRERLECLEDSALQALKKPAP